MPRTIFKANANSTDTLTDGGTTAIFEGTGYYGGTLVFNNGSGGTVSVSNVHLRIIQDGDGRTYFTDMHGGRDGFVDLGDTLETYGLKNLVSITPIQTIQGSNHRTSPDNGAYYDPRGSVADVNIEGTAPSNFGTIRSIVPCFKSGTMIATTRGPVAV